MESEETIKVKCPFGHGVHAYPITVCKSHVMYQMTLEMMRTPPNPTFKHFRRIFTCPVNGETFQAVIKIPEHFGEN
jgi:hypothetical protein